MAVFGAEIIVDNSYFLQSFGIGQYGRFIEAAAHDGQPVKLDIVLESPASIDTVSGILGPTGYADTKRTDRRAVIGIVAWLNSVLQRGVIQRILVDVWNRVDHLRSGGA